MGDGDYIYAFQNIVMPIAMEFAPELVISKYLVFNVQPVVTVQSSSLRRVRRR